MNKFNFAEFNEDVARNEVENNDGEVYEDGKGEGVVHDDGFMHVSFGGKRYAFYLGQELSRNEYKKQANTLLKKMRVSGKVSDSDY